MAYKPVEQMSFDEWQSRHGGPYRCLGTDEQDCDAEDASDGRLATAAAHDLYQRSRDVPDGVRGLYRATALALIGKPVDPELLHEAAKNKSDDDFLIGSKFFSDPTLSDVWHYHDRVDIDAKERAYYDRIGKPIPGHDWSARGVFKPKSVAGDTVFSFKTNGFAGGDRGRLEIEVRPGSALIDFEVDARFNSPTLKIDCGGDIELEAMVQGLEYLARELRIALPR